VPTLCESEDDVTRDSGTAVGQGGRKRVEGMETYKKQKIATNTLVSVQQQC